MPFFNPTATLIAVAAQGVRYTGGTDSSRLIARDNYSPHPITKKCHRVANWAEAHNVEIAYTPTNSSWLNWI